MHFIIRWFPILVQLETFFVSRIDAVGRQRSAGFGQGWGEDMGRLGKMQNDGAMFRVYTIYTQTGEDLLLPMERGGW